jgi:gamma-glutamyl:cysteine ligase YbdK (ATP-grasp superfamily)
VGLRIDRDRFEEADYARFSARLERSLVALRELLERPGFGVGPASLGTELELFLVDAEGRPLPLNYAVLRETVDPRLTVELDRFNLECNLRPTLLAGRPFSDLARELHDALAEVRRSARPYGGRVAMIGILPTLRAEDLQRGAMTDTPRFRALAAGLQRLRQQPFRVSIDGEDPLQITCDDLTFEGANTSLQVHLRVDPSAFADTYNAMQLATAPVLAVAANSPTFLGHRLWEETRVALFKQAVDHRRNVREREARVSFGSAWVTEGAFELFAESVALHEPLLPVLGEEDPLEVVRAGGVPRLDEIRLHQGTVWTWNRAIYDPEDGGHLRIEMRGLPAGPSVDDMVANVAFLVGLGLGLAAEAPDWIRQLPFETAESNFYRAAQTGLDAELGWPPAPGEAPTLVRARDLVLRLLPLAKRGLEAAGVGSDEIDARLELIHERTRSGRTGACWQRRVVEELEPRMGRARALSLMLERYLECGERGLPVHRWPLLPAQEQQTIRVLEGPEPDEIPAGIEDFLRWLGGPTLIRVAGRDRSRTRAVSTLIHGNEPSGVRAVHAWLRAGNPPAVDTVFFIGAVAAALAPPGFDHRQLPGAADLNRRFRQPFEGREGEIASEALRLLRGVQPEALVDLHNNSGHSPPYGVGPRAGAEELELVACFAGRFVHSRLRLGALVEATQADFPSVTIECGCSGDPEADAVARAGLEQYLGVPRFGGREERETAVEILADPVRVRLRPGVRLAFGQQRDAEADLTMLAEIDRRNFRPMPAGESIGWLGERSDWPIEALDADGHDVSHELFEARDGMLRSRREGIPLMMTTDSRIALSDCLFYLVRRAERDSA